MRQLTKSLSECTSSDLRAEVRTVRIALAKNGGRLSPEISIAAAALATESLRRTTGVDLYDVQLLATLRLAEGCVVQMQTGEGKTYVAIATAAILGLVGRGVHVMTPNIYLAERDFQTAKTALQHLDLTVGLTPEQGSEDLKRKAYDCDVTYGTGHEFGFDYLRDQLSLRQLASEPLGARILRELESSVSQSRPTIQRGLHFAIIDEADSVMFDDATSPLVLSAGTPGEASDKAAYTSAEQLAKSFIEGQEFRTQPVSNHIELTRSGIEKCHAKDVIIPTDVLQRPWTSYVEQALVAAHTFRKDVHYVVDDNEIKIVDQTTGRIFNDRSWQNGLHQAIESKEKLAIRPEKKTLARISRQRFFRLYQNLCGMTGTAVGCEREFSSVYGCTVENIPLHRPCRRLALPPRFFADRSSKLQAVAKETVHRHKTGQPILIGTQSIADSHHLAELLVKRGVSFEILNGLQAKVEAAIVREAGQRSAVTIATNLAGRGTDIHISEEVKSRGGLHVIVAECQLSSRMDRQLIGRSGRQGDPGSAQIYVSAEDMLIRRYGPWLGDTICAEADDSGEAHADYSRQLLRLQKAAEKKDYAARLDLLKSDIATDNLFGIRRPI